MGTAVPSPGADARAPALPAVTAKEPVGFRCRRIKCVPIGWGAVLVRVVKWPWFAHMGSFWERQQPHVMRNRADTMAAGSGFLPYRAQLLLNGLLFIVSLGFSQPVCASAPTVHYTSDSRCTPPWVAQTTASPQGSSPINASVGWRDGAGGGRILVRHTTRRQAPTGSSDVGPTLLGTKKSKVGHGRSGQHMERLWTDEMN